MSNEPILKPGDIVTVEGIFKKRNFWQRITRRPRELQKLVIGEDLSITVDTSKVEQARSY